MSSVHFIVYGEARPKGSMRSILHSKTKKPITLPDNPKTKSWADTVRVTAQSVRDTSPFFVEGRPVRLVLCFELQRPKNLCTKSKRGLYLWHTKKPDLDKLTRAVKDALTGVFWTDDSQVSQLAVEKTYCEADRGPCCHVTVEEMHTVREGLLA